MIMEETASTTGSSNLYERMTHIFGQDSFFKKDHMRIMCLARWRLGSIARSIDVMSRETA
jgi:hypothetical protein